MSEFFVNRFDGKGQMACTDRKCWQSRSKLSGRLCSGRIPAKVTRKGRGDEDGGTVAQEEERQKTRLSQ
jgi:hypothetical protein